jgi:hypothetical protein
MSKLVKWLKEVMRPRQWGYTENHYTHLYYGPFGSYGGICRRCGLDRALGGYYRCSGSDAELEMNFE